MTPTRPVSRRLAVTGGLTGGLLAGLAVTAPLLAVAEPAPDAPPASTVIAHSVAAPSALAPRPPQRASRSARPALPAPRTVSRTVSRTVEVGRTFHGLASWYGGSFHGRRTANGEVYDAEGLTAASRTLPFGTRLRVCRDERCVVVRVNDRGPFVDSRVLDLSRGASRALGFDGVARVSATPVATRRVTVHPRPRPVRRHVRPVSRPVAPHRVAVPVTVTARPPEHEGASSLGVLAAGMVGMSGVGLAGRRQPRDLEVHLRAGAGEPS